MFSRTDRGICWMAGEGDDPQIVASAFVDAVGAEKVVARARQHARGVRQRHRPRHSARNPSAWRGSSTCSADILDVIPADEEQVWNERIAARLAERWPDRSTAAGRARQVTSALKPHGIKTGQVWGTDRRRQGRQPARHQARRSRRCRHSP